MGKVAFKQCDLERALRAVKAVDIPGASVEITTAGSIVVLTNPPPRPVASNDGAVDLDAELEAWRQRNGDG